MQYDFFLFVCFPPSRLHSPAHLQAERFVDSITTEGSAAFHYVLAGGMGSGGFINGICSKPKQRSPFCLRDGTRREAIKVPLADR